jgi:hypothetical protein
MMTPDGCLSRGPIYNTEYLIGRAAGNRPPPSAAHLQKRNAIVSLPHPHLPRQIIHCVSLLLASYLDSHLL